MAIKVSMMSEHWGMIDGHLTLALDKLKQSRIDQAEYIEYTSCLRMLSDEALLAYQRGTNGRKEELCRVIAKTEATLQDLKKELAELGE